MNQEKIKQPQEIRFDNYVDTYKKKIENSIDFIGQDVDFFIEIKANMLLAMTEKNIGDLKTINALDVGCGIGLVDKYIALHLNSLTGVDVESGVIQKAKMSNPAVNYDIYNGIRLPFDDNSFELVFAINVIHHVPPGQWQNFTNEMARVLKPGGLAAIFEHNPVNPLTRKVVKDCEFDRDAILLPRRKIVELLELSELKIIDKAFIVFFPFKSKIFRSVEKLLGWLPLGAQHYAAGKKEF